MDGLYITQPSDSYAPSNHRTWQKLYNRILPHWEHLAPREFLDGLHRLELPSDRIPRLEDVNARLKPLTGFGARAVAGYVPAFIFFDCLRRREFPTTVTIRNEAQLDYLPEPDIFHDICGHVPMHACPAFADTLVRFGECAHTAAELVSDLGGERERLKAVDNILRALARFFWFSIEFGLMRTPEGMKACGSGLLSSYGEIEHSVRSPEVERRPFRLEEVVHQPFDIDHYQPLLYYIESFEQLYGLVDDLERWMRAGKINEVAPGEPSFRESDLRSFLEADAIIRA